MITETGEESNSIDSTLASEHTIDFSSDKEVLLENFQKYSNLIHKRSFRSAGNRIMMNKKTFTKLREIGLDYKKFESINDVIIFVGNDKKRFNEKIIGYIANLYYVALNNKISDNTVYFYRIHDGINYLKARRKRSDEHMTYNIQFLPEENGIIKHYVKLNLIDGEE